MSEFTKYITLRENGASAVETWLQAEADGVDQITRIRLIREVFDLSLVEAKSVSVEAKSGASLKEHQGKLIEGLSKVLDSEE